MSRSNSLGWCISNLSTQVHLNARSNTIIYNAQEVPGTQLSIRNTGLSPVEGGIKVVCGGHFREGLGLKWWGMRMIPSVCRFIAMNEVVEVVLNKTAHKEYHGQNHIEHIRLCPWYKQLSYD